MLKAPWILVFGGIALIAWWLIDPNWNESLFFSILTVFAIIVTAVSWYEIRAHQNKDYPERP